MPGGIVSASPRSAAEPGRALRVRTTIRRRKAEAAIRVRRHKAAHPKPAARSPIMMADPAVASAAPVPTSPRREAITARRSTAHRNIARPGMIMAARAEAANPFGSIHRWFTSGLRQAWTAHGATEAVVAAVATTEAAGAGAAATTAEAAGDEVAEAVPAAAATTAEVAGSIRVSSLRPGD